MVRFIRSNDIIDEDNEQQLVDFKTFDRDCRQGEVQACPDDLCYLVIVAPILGVTEDFAGYEFENRLRVETISCHDAFFLSPVYKLLCRKYPAAPTEAHDNYVLAYWDCTLKAKQHPMMLSALSSQDPSNISSFLTGMIKLPRMEPFFKSINVELKKISLFQASNPHCPEISCYFEYKNYIVETENVGTTEYKRSLIPLSIKRDNFAELKSVIKDINVNCFNNNLDLAYKSYELALMTHDVKVAVLLFIICIEALYNISDRDELKYRICRNAAVFLGDTYDNAKKIFKDLKNYYDFRSTIVHRGKLPSKFNNKPYTESELSEHVKKLAEYCRESIVKYYRKIQCAGIGHEAFLEKLSDSGFGCEPYK